jgi:hypothetical protein
LSEVAVSFKALVVSLGDQGGVCIADIHRSAVQTDYDREASVNRFVGPKRIERIAGVYEAGVAAVA